MWIQTERHIETEIETERNTMTIKTGTQRLIETKRLTELVKMTERKRQNLTDAFRNTN